MKPTKYTPSDTTKIDLGTKIIHKYPTPTKSIDVAKMVMNGRHPVDKETFLIEHECQFLLYVIKGSGTVYAGNEVFEVGVGDVVFVPIDNKFAAEGKMEYITVDNPAFFMEQSEEINI